MTLTLLTTLIARQFEDDQEFSDERFQYDDHLEQLMDTSDVAKVTLKDGSVEWAGQINMKSGKCGCCGSFSRSDIAQYEFYKAM